MHRIVVIIVQLTCLALFASPCMADPIRIADDSGQEISLQKPATRVVPLYGGFTEMLVAIGAGPSLIARTQADESPPEVGKLPSIGTHMHPNIEMIVGLKPDLVVQSASRHSATPEIEQIQSSGVPVAVFSLQTFDEIFSAMERLGVLTGRADASRNCVAALKKRLEAVKNKVAGIGKKPRVFFEVRAEPLSAAGKDTIVQEILTAAGAENVVTGEGIVHYDMEALLADNPDVVIVQTGPMNRNPIDPGKRAHYDQLKAVREGKIVTVDELLFSRPGPHAVDAVEQLAAALFPDLFAGKGAAQSAASAPGQDSGR